MEQKELWPGAGLWLDVANITAADFAVVEHRLEEIGDTLAQITFLKKLEIEFKDLERRHYANLQRTENIKEETEEVKNPVIMDFLRRSIEFGTALFIKLDKLNAIREIEREEERERREMPALAPSPADIGVIEDEQGPGKWTNEQAAVALYALLRAAGLPDMHNKTAVARFVHLLTGRSQDKMKKAGYEATAGTFSDAGAEAVIVQFEQMGLMRLAEAIRDKNFTKL